MSFPLESEQYSMQSDPGSIRGIPGEPGYNPLWNSDEYPYLEGEYNPFLIDTENGAEQTGESDQTEPGV